ncbi:MAG: methylated-DNA--[protein]-cysteine S-methyltransferase [Oscillospiraceae bacterium]|nr:methylated-DNA--[protein]-cysteine S-methyltransferase [Oscillospiraceae bacterium]
MEGCADGGGFLREAVDTPVGRLECLIAGGRLLGLRYADGGEGAEACGGSGEPAQKGASLELGTRRRGEKDADVLLRLRRQLGEYFSGRLRAFDLPIRLCGTPFRIEVWKGLLKIPYGSSSTYSGIAAGMGRPTACRAVGQANHANPISIVVPCHRVIGSDGGLRGYAGGLEAKRALLALESEAPSRKGGPKR